MVTALIIFDGLKLIGGAILFALLFIALLAHLIDRSERKRNKTNKNR